MISKDDNKRNERVDNVCDCSSVSQNGTIIEVSKQNNDFSPDQEMMQSMKLSDKFQVEKDNKKKKVIGIGVGVFLLLGILIGIVVFNNYNERKEVIALQQEEKKQIEEYNACVDNLNLLYATTLSGATEAEEICVLTLNVWQDAIYGDSSDETEKYVSGAVDFNEALNRVYADEAIQEKLLSIQTAKESANTYVQNLQSSPEELSKAYDVALETNTTFSALADLALSPEGSYNTFSETESDRIDAYILAYKTLEAVIPEKKTVPLYDAKGNRIEDQFVFDIYLNQLGDKLPETADDSLASMGYYTDVVTVCGVEGEIYYNAGLNNVVQYISWSVKNSDEAVVDEIVNKLREKYGEENVQEDNSYSWSDNLACNVLMSVSGDEVEISWLSVL